jgi:outer membrane protein assembly factor BamD
MALLVVAVATGSTGCFLHRKPKAPAAGAADADKYLYTRGSEQLQKKNWVTAREYFKRIVDSYPQSIFRADAKLGVGDSYLGEGRLDSLILAVNEFREFLQFFPLNPRADYAQYRLTLAQSKQMLNAERDQTATHDTLTEVQKFHDNFPNSEYKTEVDKIYRIARDRLSESEFHVGLLYYRGHGMAGALGRFTGILNDDPDYSKRDQVYFYTAEACMKLALKPEALQYYEKLVAEYPKSKFFKTAQQRLATLKPAGK